MKEHTRVIKMDKNRLKIALAVLDAIKSRFPETQEFIDTAFKEECEKEGMNRWGNLSLLNLQKLSLDKHFCFRFGTKVLIFLFIDMERLGR